MSRGGKTKISEMDKKYFREIFNLYSENEKITHDGLNKIFEMVDFKPNEKQDEEFKYPEVDPINLEVEKMMNIFSSM